MSTNSLIMVAVIAYIIVSMSARQAEYSDRIDELENIPAVVDTVRVIAIPE